MVNIGRLCVICLLGDLSTFVGEVSYDDDDMTVIVIVITTTTMYFYCLAMCSTLGRPLQVGGFPQLQLLTCSIPSPQDISFHKEQS